MAVVEMDWNKQESYAHDEKIYSLEPIVVLRKLSLDEVSAHIRGGNAEKNFSIANTQSIRKKDLNGKGILCEKYEKGTPTKKVRFSSVRRMRHVSRKNSKQNENVELDKERPYQCSECEESFHTGILLAVHKRIHEKELEEKEFNDDDNKLEESSCDSEMLESRTPRRISLTPTPDTPLYSKNKHRMPSHQIIILSSKSPCTNRINSVPSQPKDNNCKGNNLTAPTEQHNCLECPAHFSCQWYLKLHMILLHFRNGNNSLACPACFSNCETERHLRKHVTLNHSEHVEIMNHEISSSLSIPTSALTGERSQTSRDLRKDSQKRKNASLDFSSKSNGLGKYEVVLNRKSPHITPAQRGSYLEVVEEELRRSVMERLGMGDNFVTTDIQRLALEISDSLHVMPFANGLPPKIWARRFLIGLESQFNHALLKSVKMDHMNAVYIQAVTELLSHNLTESNIFYVCEGGLCCVDGNRKINKILKSSTENESSLLGDTLSVVLSANATGTVLLDPTLVLRGQILNYKDVNQVDLTTPFYASKNLIENNYFREWFLHFVLSIPPARPVLLLLEGHVSQIPYQVILMARAHNVHIAFEPSRKRFLHPHQLIREALLAPLRQSFERKTSQFLEMNKKSSVTLLEFKNIFELSWKAAKQKAEISKSFIEAGFVPLSEVLNSSNYANTAEASVAKFPNVSASKRDDFAPHITNTPNKTLTSHSSTVKPAQSAYKCPLCAMNFSEERDLHKHVCATNEYDLFSCHHCGMSFALKDTLEFHLTKHENTQCSIEEYVSDRRGSHKIQSHSSDIIEKKRAKLDEVAPHAKKNRKFIILKMKNNILNSSNQSTIPSQSNSNLLQKLEALFGLPCSYAGSLGSSSTSSASSRRSETMTASSTESEALKNVTSWNVSEVEIKEELIHDDNRDQYQRSHLPPPPLPEHDYLGQLYHSWDSTKTAVSQSRRR